MHHMQYITWTDIMMLRSPNLNDTNHKYKVHLCSFYVRKQMRPF